MATDPTFKEIRDKFPGKSVEINLDTASLDKADEIVKSIHSVDKEMTATRKAKYDSIPNDVSVDEKSFNDALNQANIDDVTRAHIDTFNGNFKKLFTWSNTDLKKQISRAVSEQDYERASDLRWLKKNIHEDQLDTIANNARTGTGQFKQKRQDVVDAVDEARRYEKEEYAPPFRGSDLKQVQKNRRDLYEGSAIS